ncbi:MAG: hypothetical protein WDO74_36440 [Pseudomonadota bacterium]
MSTPPRIEAEPGAGSRPVSTPALDWARSAVQRVLADTEWCQHADAGGGDAV